jgi:hypothetical protein
VASFALARESTEIISARYLGMGGCFVAGAVDRSLLFANPAGLDRIEGRVLTTMGVVATVNSKTFDVASFMIDNMKDFENLGDKPNAEQDRFFDKIVSNIDFKRSTMAFSAIPFGWMERRFGGAIFADTRASGIAFGGASATPLVNADAAVDFGAIGGYGHGWTGLQSFLPNRLSVGASLKYIHRSAYSLRETVTEMADGEAPGILSGSTVGLDLGLLYDINPSITVGAAVYDALASDIKWSGDASVYSAVQPGAKQQIDPSLRLGVVYRPGWSISHVTSQVLAFDLSEPFDSDVTFWKKIHIGAEASIYRDWFKARVGISEGYPTAGLSLWMINYAYYAEEAGRHAGQLVDRRHVLSIAL